ncbi:hypothetical protein ACLOJK_007978 [Asimina triloba]
MQAKWWLRVPIEQQLGMSVGQSNDNANATRDSMHQQGDFSKTGQRVAAAGAEGDTTSKRVEKQRQTRRGDMASREVIKQQQWVLRGMHPREQAVKQEQ